MTENLKGWNEMIDGGVIVEAGSAKKYKTGSWKTTCPHIDFNKCAHCLLCWWYCPDSSILVENSKITGVDLDHCKGCGICAQVCPDKIKAIEMKMPKDDILK